MLPAVWLGALIVDVETLAGVFGSSSSAGAELGPSVEVCPDADDGNEDATEDNVVTYDTVCNDIPGDAVVVLSEKAEEELRTVTELEDSAVKFETVVRLMDTTAGVFVVTSLMVEKVLFSEVEFMLVSAFSVVIPAFEIDELPETVSSSGSAEEDNVRVVSAARVVALVLAKLVLVSWRKVEFTGPEPVTVVVSFVVDKLSRWLEVAVTKDVMVSKFADCVGEVVRVGVPLKVGVFEL
ncbi:hypothetical protein MRX96_014765 [Rhipicephalus microplus]